MAVNFVAASDEALSYGDNRDGTAAFTVLCWFYRDIDSGGGEELVTKDESTNGFRSWGLNVNNSDQVQCRVTDDGTATNRIVVAGTTTLSPLTGAWNSCGFVLDSGAANRLEVYLNGQSDGSTTYTNGAPFNTSVPLYIGGRYDSDGVTYPNNVRAPFDGRIAQVAIWERALTDAEIAVYHATGGNALAVPGGLPVFYAPLHHDGRDIIGSLTATDQGTPDYNQPHSPTILFALPQYGIAASGTSTTGTAAPQEAADTSAASGTITRTGTLAKTEVADTSAASGTITRTGTAASTEVADTSAGTGTVSGVNSGTGAPQESRDNVVAIGTAPRKGSGSSKAKQDLERLRRQQQRLQQDEEDLVILLAGLTGGSRR